MYNTDTMNFTSHLRYFRERAGLTKTELAKRLEVTMAYIIHIESGTEKPPNMDRCRELAKILSLSPEETITFIDSAMFGRFNQDELEWLLSRCPDQFGPKKVAK